MSTKFKVLWQDKDLNLFKEDLVELLGTAKADKEELISKKLIEQTTLTLERMVEHHFELKHMHDVERHQIDEIDKLREKCKDSQEKVKVLADIRKTLEGEIADLRGQLQFSQDESASRKCCIEERDECLAVADQRKKDEKGVYEGKLKDMNDVKDAEIKELQDEINELKEQNDKMSAAVNSAERGTNALKEALNMCQDTLKDAVTSGAMPGEATIPE